MAKSHPDVNFEVEDATGRDVGSFRTFDEAASKAVIAALGTGRAILDVVVHSRSGAKWVQGDDGVAQYMEDPDASVFQRLEIRVNDQGRIA
jgi:hypothetical protein